MLCHLQSAPPATEREKAVAPATEPEIATSARETVISETAILYPVPGATAPIRRPAFIVIRQETATSTKENAISRTAWAPTCMHVPPAAAEAEQSPVHPAVEAVTAKPAEEMQAVPPVAEADL